jgi:hypothetical protein
MGGSNDIDEGVAIPTIMDNLVRIATGLRTGRVTLSTIPPEDGVEDEVEALNATSRRSPHRRGGSSSTRCRRCAGRTAAGSRACPMTVSTPLARPPRSSASRSDVP